MLSDQNRFPKIPLLVSYYTKKALVVVACKVLTLRIRTIFDRLRYPSEASTMQLPFCFILTTTIPSILGLKRCCKGLLSKIKTKITTAIMIKIANFKWKFKIRFSYPTIIKFCLVLILCFHFLVKYYRPPTNSAVFS